MWKWYTLFLLAVTFLVFNDSNRETISADAQAEITAETKYVALTFDDGPKPGTTDRLLDGLRERGASATFFLVGEQAVAAPELVKRMKEEGHQIGNHTWSHVRLEGKKKIEIRADIENMDNFLSALLGEGEYWLRPPYGAIEPALETSISVPMVKWSVDTRDWESRNKEKIVQAALSAVEPDSIILLHDIYAPSVDAALEIVDRLQAEEYWFVTVEELLRLNGVTPQPGVLYRTGKG